MLANRKPVTRNTKGVRPAIRPTRKQASAIRPIKPVARRK